MIRSGKSYSYWLARFNWKMSFHFPWVVPLISDRSVSHNGKQPSFLPSVQKCTLNFSNSPIFPADLRFPLSLQKSGFQPCNSGKKMKTFLNLRFKVKKKK